MALLQRVGLGGREKDRVGSYSKGMKQRLMVARSPVNNPRIFFLDEPTEGLDPVSSETIRSVIPLLVLMAVGDFDGGNGLHGTAVCTHLHLKQLLLIKRTHQQITFKFRH